MAAMSVTIRRATDADYETLLMTDGRAFGFTPTAEDIEGRRPLLDMDRFVLAHDGGELVGVTGSFGLQVTMPGGGTLPMGGVTYVGVLATHRRQGILRRLIAACHDDIRERGEPIAGLLASESGIYERFGYGPATTCWSTTIDRHRTALRDDLDLPAGGVRYVSGEDAASQIAAVWERYRCARVGELHRWPELQRRMHEVRERPRGTFSPAFVLVHADGYAAYRIEQHWDEGHPAHVMDVVELAAITDDAHAALWATLFGVDLVGTINSRVSPVDDALPYLLVDPRAVRTVGLTDWLWANPFDVAACLEARRYEVADRLVLEVDGRRWTVDGAPDGVSVAKARTRPDVTLTGAALGGLLFGGVSVSTLVAGRRAAVRSASVLRRADAFFRTGRAPHCQTGF
jgi:predicted acetyltransferase